MGAVVESEIEIFRLDSHYYVICASYPLVWGTPWWGLLCASKLNKETKHMMLLGIYYGNIMKIY